MKEPKGYTVARYNNKGSSISVETPYPLDQGLGGSEVYQLLQDVLFPCYIIIYFGQPRTFLGDLDISPR